MKRGLLACRDYISKQKGAPMVSNQFNCSCARNWRFMILCFFSLFSVSFLFHVYPSCARCRGHWTWTARRTFFGVMAQPCASHGSTDGTRWTWWAMTNMNIRYRSLGHHYMHFGPFVQELLQTPQKMIRDRGPEDLARSPAKFGRHDAHGTHGLMWGQVANFWDVRRLERDSRSEHSYPNEGLSNRCQ